MMDLASMELGTELPDPEKEREEWMRKRSGRFTCSRFGDLMSEGRRKDEIWSAAGRGYIYQIAAERMGSWRFEFDSAPTRWGKENELQAITLYCMLNKVANMRCGPETWHEHKAYAGGTPDALIEDDGMLEIKCPYDPAVHVRYLFEGGVPREYRWQIIGHLLVTGREWCDFISFDPRINTDRKLYVHRVTRDDVKADIQSLDRKLELANDEVIKVLGS